jgi:regulation of enolase protein 1 (concanavalin A-like superfamily)
MVLKRLHSSFLLAEVTVSADFAMDHDQAGLVIFAGSLPDPANIRSSLAAVRRSPWPDRGDNFVRRRWAKAGLEFARGELHAASSVATSSCGADWSSSARMPSFSASAYDPFSLAPQSLRIRFERVEDSLWISYEIPNLGQQQQQPEFAGYHHTSMMNAGSTEFGLQQQPSPGDVGSRWKQMREVMGFFGGVEQKGNIWVGCYASRPMDYEPSNSWEEVDELIAEFEDLDIL